ncbi:Holliday junction resolvase RuvX [Paludibacter sp.]
MSTPNSGAKIRKNIIFAQVFIMGRILAIDYGQKRAGLAVTDPLKITANALDTVPVHEIFDFLRKYMTNEQVEKIIVGLPKQMSGELSSSMQYIEPFVRGLKNNFPNIPIEYVDERFTSSMAQKVILEAGAKRKDRQNKALVDKVAATIILQTYLESNR